MRAWANDLHASQSVTGHRSTCGDGRLSAADGPKCGIWRPRASANADPRTADIASTESVQQVLGYCDGEPRQVLRHPAGSVAVKSDGLDRGPVSYTHLRAHET